MGSGVWYARALLSPWFNRPWVETAAGRQAMVGTELDCRKCDTGAPPDTVNGRPG